MPVRPAESPRLIDATDRLSRHRMAIGSVILAGIVAALQVGKAPIALAQMQAEFGRSLAALSTVMSVFPLIGVLGGVAVGAMVQHWGDRRLLGLGLLVIAAASAAGAMVERFDLLLATRIIEGLGFLLTVVAAPAMLHRLARPGERALVFGAWSTFMAIGIALSMLIGPHLGGWRPLWRIDAMLALLALPLVLLTSAATTAPSMPRGAGHLCADLRMSLRAPAPRLLALTFATYTLQFSVLSFLPIFLLRRAQLPPGIVGGICAAVVAANALGNLGAAPLLNRGVRPGQLLSVASVTIGVAGAAVFLPALPTMVVIALGFAYSAIAGLIPATVLTCAPLAAPTPALAPISLGLLMQGNYLGQVLGPALIGAAVGAHGWPAAALPVLLAAALGAVFGQRFARTATGAAYTH